jgi:hypothetical protein
MGRPSFQEIAAIAITGFDKVRKNGLKELEKVKRVTSFGYSFETLQAFAFSMGQDLRLGDDDIEMKRGLFDSLEVKVTLTVENNQKVIYLTCAIPQWADVLSVKTVVGI